MQWFAARNSPRQGDNGSGYQISTLAAIPEFARELPFPDQNPLDGTGVRPMAALRTTRRESPIGRLRHHIGAGAQRRALSFR